MIGPVNRLLSLDRNRVATLVNVVIDRTLDLHDKATRADVKILFGMFAADLAFLASAIRDGAEPLELAVRLEFRDPFLKRDPS